MHIVDTNEIFYPNNDIFSRCKEKKSRYVYYENRFRYNDFEKRCSYNEKWFRIYEIFSRNNEKRFLY
jgi:hypothetical protein